jgi:NTP pyrophosphatase (non-canonical NTP hydrolase)
MNTNQYQDEVKRTFAKCETEFMDHIHMASGIVTEASELLDAYKKYIAYKKPLDLANLKEEVGDILWYIANYCNINGWSMEDIMATNIAKLRVRYPEKFDEFLAVNRNLNEEYKILNQ